MRFILSFAMLLCFSLGVFAQKEHNLPNKVNVPKPQVKFNNDNVKGSATNITKNKVWVEHNNVHFNNHYYNNRERFNATYHDYHTRFGHRASFGYYYTGINHYHWSYWTFSQDYGTYLYYDPFVAQYYYFCQPDNAYYPITYVPYARFAW